MPKSSLPLRQAVLGSAAAPTYFPRHHFQADGKIYNLVDGGMAANNPVNHLHTKAFMESFFARFVAVCIHNSFFIFFVLDEAASSVQTLLAIREAINIFGSRDDNRYLVISLGTGAEGDHHDFVNLGSPFDWILDLKRGIPPLASLLFETSADMVDTYTSIFLGGGQNSRHQFLRIQVNALQYRYI